MKELYMTRHGQTEWNIERRLQGSANSPLTEKGVRDAKELAKRVAEIPFDKVYTSDLLRAVQTADLLTEGREIPRVVLPELREMRMGRWEGQLIADMTESDKEQYENFVSGSPEFAAPGGETILEVRMRAEEALAVIEKDEAEIILVVTHGMLQSQLLEILQGRPFGENTRVLPGTALSHFTYEDGKYTGVLVGCTRHMEG